MILLVGLTATMNACHPISTDERTGEKVVTLKVNEHYFKIPWGYVWAYDRGKNGTLIGANLHALYPGFEPKTRQNKEVFDQLGRGGGRLVTFLIKDLKTIKPISRIIARYLSEGKEVGPYRQDGDFYIYPARNNKKEFILTTLNGENNTYFYCSIR